MEEYTDTAEPQKPVRFEDVTIKNFRLLSTAEAAEMYDIANKTDVAIDFELHELIQKNQRLQAL